MPPPGPPGLLGPLDVRRAGVLLHITSLPAAHGPGDLGPASYAFVDFLADAGCTVWQVLPLVPTHEEDRSPYNAVSAMAGNPELLSRERIDETDPEFSTWCREQAAWLEDYVGFVALRESQGGTPWPEWPVELRDRDPVALAEALAPLGPRLAELRLGQWAFARQWQQLRAYAAERGVLFFGDLPIFVSHDSADVWAHRELFELDDEGQPTTVTGVPPDYFAADGQRWNNPHYDWDRMARDGFAWWRLRVARQRELFDLVRIDHFRGFESAWHVPVDAPTARDGAWVTTPGHEVLSALVDTAGEGTLVAEDLGTITSGVDELRRAFGLPGMRVLQFGFDGNPDNPHLPHRHEQNTVVYTGTHDNDTTLGWWESLDEGLRHMVSETAGGDMPWDLVRLALGSPGALAVVPAQDLLALGSDARMNTPGTDVGNWSWQAPPGAFDADLAARLRALVESTHRHP